MIRAYLLVMLVASVAAGSPTPADAAPDILRVGGTGSALRSLERLGAAFASTDATRVEVVPSLGSGGSVKALRAGAIDLAVLSRAPTASEKDGLLVAMYARTPFVFAVANEPVERISLQQLVDLYSGWTTRWPSGEPVRIILRPETDSDTTAMRAMSPALSSALDAALERKGMIMALSDQEAADDIAAIPGAIGPTTLAIVATEQRPLKILALGDVPPSVAALADGRYPYSKSFHLLYRPEAPDGIKRFVTFLRSPPARDLLETLGQQQTAD